MTAADDQPQEPQQEPWRPLDVRSGDASAEEYDALHEGIPSWLENSLWRWMRDRCTSGGMALLYKIERYLRVSIQQRGSQLHPVEMVDRFFWSAADDEARLQLVDYLLYDIGEQYRRLSSDPRTRDQTTALAQALIGLMVMLSEAGSAWTVEREPRWGLVRRLNEASQAAVKQAASHGNDAGLLIKRAWHNCYRFEPDHDAAYRDAVLAVESAASTVMTPRDPSPSLGKVIGHLLDTRDRWTVAGLTATQIPSADTLLAMLQLLWHNHQRHVQQGGTMPSDVSQSEAEAALSLAVTLVQWFSAGLVRRVE